MSLTEFTTNELAAALTRSVRQCVVMGMRPHLPEPWQIFSVDALTYETLPDALKQSTFDTAKAALFLWLGGAGFRTIDAMLLSLRFIASLPKGSALLFDYSVERCFLRRTHSVGPRCTHQQINLGKRQSQVLLQPQAVLALLGHVGFTDITDVTVSANHLVSAQV